MRLIFQTFQAKYRVMLRAVFSTLRFIILILAGHKQVALADDRVMCKNLNECVSESHAPNFDR